MAGIASKITTRTSWVDSLVAIPYVRLEAGQASRSPSRSDFIPTSNTTQEYIINPATIARRRVNPNWIIHTQKESHIALKGGLGSGWSLHPSPGRVRGPTGATYVKGASRVIVYNDVRF